MLPPGTILEIHYDLNTFGIPAKVLPITSDGFLDLSLHRQWLSERRHLEASSSHSEDIGERITAPRPQDVLLGRGRTSQTHPGNVRYHSLLSSHQEAYDRGQGDRQQTSLIATSVVNAIKSAGGRFVKQDEAGWSVLSDAATRIKVTNAFRTRRKKVNDRESKNKERRKRQAQAL